MNHPKKLDTEKALDDMIQTKKLRNLNLKDVELILGWMKEYIPAYQANWTNTETVQRINKFLEDDKE